MSNVYYVYILYHRGVPVYVGMGKNDRWKHGNSGKSHVYELNRVHFLEGRDALSCRIVKSNLSKESALKLEKSIILETKSPFNKENNLHLRMKQGFMMNSNNTRVNNSIRHHLKIYNIIKPMGCKMNNSELAEHLNKKGIKTFKGAKWNKGNVWAARRRIKEILEEGRFRDEKNKHES